MHRRQKQLEDGEGGCFFRALIILLFLLSKLSGGAEPPDPSLSATYDMKITMCWLLLKQEEESFPMLRVLAHQKYRYPRSCPHLIDHIFGARITLILLFARTPLED